MAMRHGAKCRNINGLGPGKPPGAGIEDDHLVVRAQRALCRKATAPATPHPPSAPHPHLRSPAAPAAAAVSTSSATATAPPLLSRSARSIRRSPNGPGTRNPAATVSGLAGLATLGAGLEALTTGAHRPPARIHPRQAAGTQRPSRNS